MLYPKARDPVSDRVAFTDALTAAFPDFDGLEKALACSLGAPSAALSSLFFRLISPLTANGFSCYRLKLMPNTLRHCLNPASGIIISLVIFSKSELTIF